MKNTSSLHSIALLIIVAVFMAPVAHARTSKAAAALKDRASEKLKTVKFSLVGMTCDTCANTASMALAKIPGVVEAKVNFDTKVAFVRASQDVTREIIRGILKPFGWEARFPDEAPPPSALTAKEKAGLDILTVSHGEAIRIQDQLASGKYTIFDYYADWCGPCRLLTPKLERLVRDNKRVALRKVDISNWKSKAAIQATRDFKLSGLPYVRVYGPDGKFLGAVQGNHIDKIKVLIERNEIRRRGLPRGPGQRPGDAQGQPRPVRTQ